MPRPIQARIDLSALRHNYQLAKRRVSGGGRAAGAWAVVKADAYGHGLLRVARALADLADGFALLNVEDAVALRRSGIAQPILLLEGFFDPEEVFLCAELKLTPAVHCLEQLQMICAAGLPAPLPIYLKLNTGMNRLGLAPADMPAARRLLASTAVFGPVTLMTHFAEAESERGLDQPLERFAQMSEGLDYPVSLANSAALLRHPSLLRGFARPGIMLYGGSPLAGESAASLGLQSVMTLASRIIAVQEIAPGEAVGYGGTFVAERPMRLGVVACGYADGYPRHAPSGTPILVAGQRCGTVGRVSMDMLSCDLAALPEAAVGSPVVLWGEGLPADEVAATAGTISYELFCALARRVPVIEV